MKIEYEFITKVSEICGKAQHAQLSSEDLAYLLRYIGQLEDMVAEAGQEDFYGTEGWQKDMAYRMDD